MRVTWDKRRWAAARSQLRDLAANDNRSPAQRVRDAQALRRWAEQAAAKGPAWVAMAARARQVAATEMQQLRPRPV